MRRFMLLAALCTAAIRYEEPVSGTLGAQPGTPVANTALPATGGVPLVPLAGASLLLVFGVAGFAVRRHASS